MLEALRRVKHRGAVAADGKTGDGAGLLLPIPSRCLPSAGCGIGMVFLRDDADRERLERPAAARASTCSAGGRCRSTPMRSGREARASLPRIEQLLIAPPSVSTRTRPSGAPSVPASARSGRRRLRRLALVPDGHVQGSLRRRPARGVLPRPRATRRSPSPSAIFHQRFSTNTAPSWERAQPFRLLCHNGEINTIAGERQLDARARGPARLGRRRLLHRRSTSGSDSAMLDNAARAARPRRPRRRATRWRCSCPPAWEEDAELDPGVRDFYRYHSALCEPWDGPAGARLHRRPRRGRRARPQRAASAALRGHEDGLVACASEAGAVDLLPRRRACAAAARARARCSRSTRARRTRGEPRRQARGWRPRAPYGAGSRTRSRRGSCGRAGRGARTTCAAAGRPRLHAGGAALRPAADGRRTRTSRPRPWATTRRCRRSPVARGRSTPTSASASRRSRTRRSTTSASASSSRCARCSARGSPLSGREP